MKETVHKYRYFIFAALVLLIFINAAFCFALFGLIIFLVSIRFLLFVRRMNLIGLECKGKIVDYETDNDGDKAPIVEFIDLAGGKIKKLPFVFGTASISGIKLNKNRTNKPVSILYDPDDSSKFLIKDDIGSTYFIIVIFGIVGLTFFILGLLQLLGYIHMG